MKYLLLIILLFNSMLFAQELKYEEVVQLDSIRTKEELFNSARIWLNETYNSGKAVIQMEDKDLGILLGKATIKYEPNFFTSSGPARGYIDYTIKLSFKDGRYKLEFYDFIHQGSRTEFVSNGSIGFINNGEKYTGNSRNVNKSYRNKVNEDTQKQIKISIPIIISSLKEYMNYSKNIPANNNDW